MMDHIKARALADRIIEHKALRRSAAPSLHPIQDRLGGFFFGQAEGFGSAAPEWLSEAQREANATASVIGEAEVAELIDRAAAGNVKRAVWLNKVFSPTPVTI